MGGTTPPALSQAGQSQAAARSMPPKSGPGCRVPRAEVRRSPAHVRDARSPKCPKCPGEGPWQSKRLQRSPSPRARRDSLRETGEEKGPFEGAATQPPFPARCPLCSMLDHTAPLLHAAPSHRVRAEVLTEAWGSGRLPADSCRRPTPGSVQSGLPGLCCPPPHPEPARSCLGPPSVCVLALCLGHPSRGGAGCSWVGGPTPPTRLWSPLQHSHIQDWLASPLPDDLE